MSYSKKLVNDPSVVGEVLCRYRSGNYTMVQISNDTHIGMSNVHEIVKRHVPEHERRNLKRLNYRRSKLGDSNPAKGRRPGNYRGECADGYGYLTKLEGGKREFVHRIAMANAIGISVSELPSSMHVHHIDGNKHNNEIDNLALVTASAHRAIHRLSPPPKCK